MTTAGVERHYGRDGLIAAISEGLRRAGKDLSRLSPADLAPIDEFHVRGRLATQELADAVKPGRGDQVLDLGSGIGGPSRFLAATYGCNVTGVDLTEEYCRVAATLAQWVGLSDRVAYRTANALDLPFGDATFDLVWTQHVTMNIADKARLYSEAHRVLKPGGSLAIYDILQGAGGTIHFPVPWAPDPAISHLVTAEELRRLLNGGGFRIVSWRDRTAAGREFFAEVNRALAESAPPPMAIAILLGADAARMADNMRRNLDEDRIAIVELVCRRS